MIKIDFNEQEAAALLELINLAVKTAGMNVAEAAVVLSRKIREAAERAKTAVQDVPITQAD